MPERVTACKTSEPANYAPSVSHAFIERATTGKHRSGDTTNLIVIIRSDGSSSCNVHQINRFIKHRHSSFDKSDNIWRFGYERIILSLVVESSTTVLAYAIC